MPRSRGPIWRAPGVADRVDIVVGPARQTLEHGRGRGRSRSTSSSSMPTSRTIPTMSALRSRCRGPAARSSSTMSFARAGSTNAASGDPTSSAPARLFDALARRAAAQRDRDPDGRLKNGTASCWRSSATHDATTPLDPGFAARFEPDRPRRRRQLYLVSPLDVGGDFPGAARGGAGGRAGRRLPVPGEGDRPA